MGPKIGVNVLAYFSGPPENRIRLLKEDSGRAQPTTLRRGGKDKSRRLEVCVQQRGCSARGGASDLKPWTLERLGNE